MNPASNPPLGKVDVRNGAVSPLKPGDIDWEHVFGTLGVRWFYTATHRPELEILDRVGGGDSFASGFIYGLMVLQDPAKAIEYGAAHGALA